MFTVTDDGKASTSTEALRRSDRPTRLKYYWIYQARNKGWYRYEPKNEKYLEECYLRNKPTCRLFIIGHTEKVVFSTFTQERIKDNGQDEDDLQKDKRPVNFPLETGN
uniref:WWE domain-containing protein n=1 Tax=Caenorhabditis tropicalis TaxID=1561998 RepID=A0A1I7TCG9_9PELO